ncbi:hypothetical protein AL036_14920 [Salipiger aestuarii]|uniref:Putative outer membrane protein n=1 Tax=Salipiger aestuarii TaxID=568098 RepID=A0A327Y496_9RHOB|nr:outer membrane beta-barrel protein [Salipiger aestuarii]EIE52014.1 hypothetical protein C357_06032 [Citreicella sp. 357]KAA8606366.1 hypothetical protein AL036_14920 [Salipiger aestuarii]KAA8610654.1 hypothetical protein AL037_12855 [Salipiger aestuarii]KAB2541616.1 hypothetical protein AL035_11170 [Salipiger aestuarii]RAK14876.1 putative outer membrane protein [Salipiger aestuarii]
MSLKPLFILPLLAAPVLATPVLAGSLDSTPVEQRPAAPVVSVAPPAASTDWTGASLGLQLGSGTSEYDENEGGGVYGLRGTYDRDYGDWVAGGVLDYQGTDLELDDGSNMDSMAKLGGRLGYDRGNALYYGSAGYAHATTDDSDSSDGYFVGVGVETYVAPNVTLNGEVSYNVFEDFDDTDLEVGATTATLGVNYRF